MTIDYLTHPGLYHLAPDRSLVITGDCLRVLRSLPEQCVDMVFVDPPYNLQLRGSLARPDESVVDAVRDEWDQFESFHAYDAFTRAWLSAARRVMKPNGTIWVMGSYHCIHRIGTILQDEGWWLLNDVCWIKANPTPQMRGVRFCQSTEHLLWAAKTQKLARGYSFNYQALKAANGGKQMRSDWYFPICQGKERLRDAEGKKLHSTQKPIALLERVLDACVREGDFRVLDPFAGTATLAAACLRLYPPVPFIMIEQNPRYVEEGIRPRLALLQQTIRPAAAART